MTCLSTKYVIQVVNNLIFAILSNGFVHTEVDSIFLIYLAYFRAIRLEYTPYFKHRLTHSF